MAEEKQRRIRLALIGCGSHSSGNHARPMQAYAADHPDALELAAACDLDMARAEKFCEQFGFLKAYESLEKMLEAEQLDGCVSVMPMHLITPQGKDLLERGMPCMLEKPLGTSLEEIRGLDEVARRTGTPHMVSVNRRFNPYLRRALAWMNERGGFHALRATIIRQGRTVRNFLWSTAFHTVDAMRFLAGEIESYRWQATEREGMTNKWLTIAFKYANGCLGHLDVLPTAGRHEELYELIGEEYRAMVVTEHNRKPTTLQCWHGEVCELDVAAPDDEPGHIAIGPYHEVEEFVTALRSGRAPWPTVADVLPSNEVCFAIAEPEGLWRASPSEHGRTKRSGATLQNDCDRTMGRESAG